MSNDLQKKSISAKKKKKIMGHWHIVISNDNLKSS